MKKTLPTNNTISKAIITQIKGGTSLINGANNITYQTSTSLEEKQS